MRVVALFLVCLAVASAIHINKLHKVSSTVEAKGVSCHRLTTCATCVAGYGRSVWHGNYGCTWLQSVGCKKRKSSRLPSDGWIRRVSKCPGVAAPPVVVIPPPAYPQQPYAPKQVTKYCGHLPAKVCRANPNNLPDFDKAKAVIAMFKHVAVTDVGFAGPDGEMTIANKNTPATHIDASKSVYDVGVEYGKRACGSGQPAARGVGIAQQLTTPNERRLGIEAAADTVANAILDPGCMAAVCDTLALGIISKMRAAGAHVRLEWVTYRYSDKSGHSVVVANRPAVSDLNDWTTWGDDYYVLDAWYMGLLQDPSLDHTGAAGSGIRWGIEAKVHSYWEQRSAHSKRKVRVEDPVGVFTVVEEQVGRGVEAQYDSTWTSTVADRAAVVRAPIVVPAKNVDMFAVYDKSGKHIVGEFTVDELADMMGDLVKKEEGSKVFYLHQKITEDMMQENE